MKVWNVVVLMVLLLGLLLSGCQATTKNKTSEEAASKQDTVKKCNEDGSWGHYQTDERSDPIKKAVYAYFKERRAGENIGSFFSIFDAKKPSVTVIATRLDSKGKLIQRVQELDVRFEQERWMVHGVKSTCLLE